jgi:hypothetical protein
MPFSIEMAIRTSKEKGRSGFPKRPIPYRM